MVIATGMESPLTSYLLMESFTYETPFWRMAGIKKYIKENSDKKYCLLHEKSQFHFSLSKFTFKQDKFPDTFAVVDTFLFPGLPVSWVPQLLCCPRLSSWSWRASSSPLRCLPCRLFRLHHPQQRRNLTWLENPSPRNCRLVQRRASWLDRSGLKYEPKGKWKKCLAKIRKRKHQMMTKTPGKVVTISNFCRPEIFCFDTNLLFLT